VTRFIDLCDTFHLPVVNFVDQPGFLIGTRAERAGTARYGARAMAAVYQATVPWISIIIRRVFGVAGAAHGNAQALNLRYAWPSGDWGSLPIEGGVQAAYKRESATMTISIFSKPKPIIGVIHVGALPGTPAHHETVDRITAQAVSEAAIYRDCGIDGIIIENMHDVPYVRGEAGPEIVAAMAVIGRTVKAESRLTVGIQILAGANIEAMAAAHAAGLDFIRAEGYVFAHVADEGLIESSAAKLLRYRKMIGADRIEVWADIKKKHSSHMITADISLGATAEAVEFMRGDAVIVTGNVTGDAPKMEDVMEVKRHCRLPVLLGSGIDLNNIAEFHEKADGFIVGSYFKSDGHWTSAVDKERINRFMNLVNQSKAP
jgi:membrane complex biogenesis BtpA family protein